MATSAVQNLTRAVWCAECERQMVITYRGSTAGPTPTAVRCPFCDHENRVDLDGTVVSVAVRDQRKPR